MGTWLAQPVELDYWDSTGSQVIIVNCHYKIDLHANHFSWMPHKCLALAACTDQSLWVPEVMVCWSVMVSHACVTQGALCRFYCLVTDSPFSTQEGQFSSYTCSERGPCIQVVQYFLMTAFLQVNVQRPETHKGCNLELHIQVVYQVQKAFWQNFQ